MKSSGKSGWTASFSCCCLAARILIPNFSQIALPSAFGRQHDRLLNDGSARWSPGSCSASLHSHRVHLVIYSTDAPARAPFPGSRNSYWPLGNRKRFGGGCRSHLARKLSHRFALHNAFRMILIGTSGGNVKETLKVSLSLLLRWRPPLKVNKTYFLHAVVEESLRY